MQGGQTSNRGNMNKMLNTSVANNPTAGKLEELYTGVGANNSIEPSPRDDMVGGMGSSKIPQKYQIHTNKKDYLKNNGSTRNLQNIRNKRYNPSGH